MALNGLFCVDVPLSNYSLTHYNHFYLLAYLLTAFISDVTMVVLTDLIVFLTETNQKLNFYSHDNKVSFTLSRLIFDTYIGVSAFTLQVSKWIFYCGLSNDEVYTMMMMDWVGDAANVKQNVSSWCKVSLW